MRRLKEEKQRCRPQTIATSALQHYNGRDRGGLVSQAFELCTLHSEFDLVKFQFLVDGKQTRANEVKNKVLTASIFLKFSKTLPKQ